MDDKEKAILQTILYADIFNYPLTLEELHTFLLAKGPLSKNEIKKNCAKLGNVILEKNDLYCLKERVGVIQRRERLLAINQQKIHRAKKVTRLLSKIPTVLFIGISGAVAMENAEEEDDIDFFIITKKNTVWMTRLMVTILLDIGGLRRRRGNIQTKDKICLNMFVDEDALEMPKKDVYIAHEILQITPLVEKQSVYSLFLSENRWIKRYFGNLIIKKRVKKVVRTSPSLFEVIARWLQHFYMHRSRTSETLTPHFIAFHPRDYRSEVMEEFGKRLSKYRLNL